jgi:ABC-2 type transport system ATP-binding protein
MVPLFDQSAVPIAAARSCHVIVPPLSEPLVQQSLASDAVPGPALLVWNLLRSRPMTLEPILRIENLQVDYRSREMGQGTRQAVRGLNLSVFPGEVFGFLGPNGAGKTTTMNVLLGFVPATAGKAFLFGVDVREPIARQRIGYLPELTYYYKFLSAEELLRFYAKIFGLPRTLADQRIDSILKLVELEGACKRPIRTYSKGMQQRVGLAQALINNPDLLILDEPTSGLDPIGRMKVREIIQRLKNDGKTVFFSSHELGEVETVCDRVAILAEGQLKAEGRVNELVLSYQCSTLEQVFLKIIDYKLAA